ncbi:MAG: glycosyltransferase family 39 protein [Planctomycetes bacterium]|nr:glycosyltransferase family 39 protein [Planctomycetota bacterium]
MSESDNKPITADYSTEWRGELAVRPTSWPLLIAVVVLVLLPFLIASQITAHLRTDVVDDQMFGYFGWRIAHGATVYLDVWDNKPPGIYWINALGFLIGGDSYGGVIALCVIAVTVTLASFYVICGSLFHREAATLATILAGFFVTHGYFQGATNRTETFLIAFEVTAVALYMRGFARDRWWKWLLAGILCGCAFLCKQVGLVAWGAMGLHMIVLVITREVSVGDGARRCFLLLGGAAMSIGIALGALMSQGALNEAIGAVVTFNQAYFETEDSTWGYNYKNMLLLGYHMEVLRLPLLMTTAACLHGFLWALRPAARPADIEGRLRAFGPVCPRPLLLFSVWFVVAFYGANLSPHAFRHYILPTIPPLMLMSAHLLNVLTAEVGLLRRLQQRAWVAFAFVTICYFSWDSINRQWEAVSQVYVQRFLNNETPDWVVLGDAVARVTEPGDKIQCWAYLPGVYLQSRRINASRYTTTEKIGQVGEHAGNIKAELTATLLAEPPAVFLINAGDFRWLVTGLSPSGDAEEPGPLGPWLEENYERVDEVLSHFIFKRKDLIK